MGQQLFIGTLVTLGSVTFGAIMWWALVRIISASETWLTQPRRSYKTISLFVLVIVWTMAILTFGVWLWALILLRLAAFPDLEDAVYYALVAYTTLGLADVRLPEDWRLLGGMTGANGFLVFGLLTAMLTDAIRDIREMMDH